MRRSQQLEHHIVAVNRFIEALNDFLEVMEPRPEGFSGSFYQWVPKNGQEQRSAQLRAIVNQRSGPATKAAEAANIALTLREPPAVGGREHVVNAIATWWSALDPPNLLPMQSVFDYCAQVIGHLTAMRDEAEARERTLAGRVARFVRFPLDIREAAGLPGKRAVNAAAVGIGVFLQGVVVTVVGGVIVAAIILLLGWAGQ
jgi:hypothetical protein